MLHMVHLIESLHGGDNLRTGHLLKEGVNKAIGAHSIIGGDGEGVKLWVDAVRLSPEGQTSGQAELEAKKVAEFEESVKLSLVYTSPLVCQYCKAIPQKDSRGC